MINWLTFHHILSLYRAYKRKNSLWTSEEHMWIVEKILSFLIFLTENSLWQIQISLLETINLNIITTARSSKYFLLTCLKFCHHGTQEQKQNQVSLLLINFTSLCEQVTSVPWMLKHQVKECYCSYVYFKLVRKWKWLKVSLFSKLKNINLTM